jgi:RNA polymerase sigma factor (sigma-70 family)
MNVHISYKAAKASDVEREFRLHIEKLGRRLQVFRPDLVHLYGTVEQNSPREGVLVSLNLRLPSGQLAAQEKSPRAVSAVKNAFADLLVQLTRHKELLRSEHKWRRRKSRKEIAQIPQVPFEQTLAVAHLPTASVEDIHGWVNANLERLERYIARELRYRENTAGLRPGLVTREEVVDEVIATALGDGEEKPELLSLERWLYRLAMRTISDLARHNGEAPSAVPLEQSTRKPNVRASDEPQLQFHQPDEMMLGESTIGDPRVATPEDIAATDEMIDLVEAALLGARREDREAFILFAIEGFTAEEIAATTDRKPQEVKKSIEAARDHLRKTLPMSNPFKERLLHHSKTA